MARVTPRRVVRFIEQTYPWARGANPSQNVYSDQAGNLGAIVALANQLAPELLPPDPDDFTLFVAAVGLIESTLERWTGLNAVESGGSPLQSSNAFGGGSAIRAIHDVLSRCPEEASSPDIVGLDFVKDAALRESLRLDLSRAARALARGDFKSATVLSGAVIEALLLDAIEAIDAPARAAALKAWRAASKREGDPKPPSALGTALDAWTLSQLVWIAHHAAIISESAAASADVARDFRNLIHPGKARRRIPADEGTAYAAYGAALRIANELEARATSAPIV